MRTVYRRSKILLTEVYYWRKVKEMTTATRPRITIAEADAAYEKFVKPHVTPEDKRKFVEIDVDSGDFEIGKDDDEIHNRLQARRPQGRFILMGADGGDAGAFGFSHYGEVRR